LAGCREGSVDRPHALEEAERVEPLLGLLNLRGRVRLLFLYLDLAPDHLVRGLGVAGNLDPVDQHLVARGDCVGDVDPMRLRVDLRAWIHVDERVAAVGIKIRKRQHVMLHFSAAEDLVGLERGLGGQLVLGELEVAGNADLADFEDRTLIDRHRDDNRIVMTGNGGIADMHLQIAMVVVEGGYAVAVVLQFRPVQRAGVEEAAQQVTLARLHQTAQSARRESSIADELNVADLDQRPLNHMEDADRGVARPGHRSEREVGVEIALALIDLPQGLYA
jgi:hypothetical protein